MPNVHYVIIRLEAEMCLEKWPLVSFWKIWAICVFTRVHVRVCVRIDAYAYMCVWLFLRKCAVLNSYYLSHILSCQFILHASAGMDRTSLWPINPYLREWSLTVIINATNRYPRPLINVFYVCMEKCILICSVSHGMYTRLCCTFYSYSINS